MPGENRRFLFSDADLEVLSFSGMEGISQLYQFELELVALSPNVAFDRLLNKSARLTIRGPDSTVRDVHGVVSRFEMVTTISQRTIYRAILTPPHFKLTLRRRLRVFQDLTTEQIVTQVLQEGGISPTSLSWTLKETYKPRNYCVQYRESDMDFVARLLEEEGIAYHFQHTASELKTVFSDHQGAYQPIPGKANVVFNTTGLVSGEEMVSRFSFGQQLRSGAVYLRDYNFRKPRVPVEGKAQGADPLLEVYDYPGEFVEPELGMRLAMVRLQQQELGRLSGMGSTTCMRMSPGCRFTLGGTLEGEEYPRKELNNQEYLLTTVTHSGHQPHVLGEEGAQGTIMYSNTIAVVPSKTPFRPPRVTPRPEVLGTHAARVVGPPGEELYVDPYGRVKVRFHWEREQKNTAWIRVAADYAGAGFGNLFPPRVGQEVLVDFLEGDPDRPVVTGRVYNGEQVVPGTLPGGKTGSSIRTNSSPPTSGADVSTGLLDGFKVNEGYNELAFEDSKEHEELRIHAQKDYNVVVENDRTTLVKRDRKETVKRDQKEVVERHRTLNVKLDSLHTARTTLLQSADTLTLRVGDGSTGTSIEMTPTSMTFSATNIESSAVMINDIRGGIVKLPGLCGQGEEQMVDPDPPAGGSGKGDASGVDTFKKLARFTAIGGLPVRRLGDVMTGVGKSMLVNGTPEFQAQVLSDLQRLSQTKSGLSLLRSIDSNPGGNKVTIQETALRNRFWSGSPARRGVDGTRGPGADGYLYYDADRTKRGDEPWQTRPPVVGLGHELIHADDAVNGKRAPDELVENDGLKDPSDPSRPAMMQRYEAETVGLPGHDTEAETSENDLRRELGEPERKWYD